MVKRFLGTMDIGKLRKAMSSKHSSLFKTEKGFEGANVLIWQNDEPDQWGNTISIQLNGKMDAKEDKVYFINAKPPKEKTDAPSTGTDIASDPQDLPF